MKDRRIDVDAEEAAGGIVSHFCAKAFSVTRCTLSITWIGVLRLVQPRVERRADKIQGIHTVVDKQTELFAGAERAWLQLGVMPRRSMHGNAIDLLRKAGNQPVKRAVVIIDIKRL